jgi:hypothetical protein
MSSIIKIAVILPCLVRFYGSITILTALRIVVVSVVEGGILMGAYIGEI